MQKWLATTAIALLAIATPACSGDDDGEPSVAAESTTTGAGATLADIRGRQTDAVIKVTYQRGAETFTIAQDHDKHAIVTDRSMLIVTGDQTVDCSALDTQPTCLEVPEGVSSLVNLAFSFYNVVTQSLEAAADSIPTSALTETELVGRTAVCAEGDTATFLSDLTSSVGSVPPGNARVCVDEATGYLLAYSNDADPADNLLAIEVGEPSDADFEPPAAVDGLTDA
jgi:hypothetical protein